MKKNRDTSSVVVVVLFLIATIGASWGVTCGLVKLITMCFGWKFSWAVSTGIWLIFVLFNWMVKSNKE